MECFGIGEKGDWVGLLMRSCLVELEYGVSAYPFDRVGTYALG